MCHSYQRRARPQLVLAAVEQRDMPIVREWIGQFDGSFGVYFARQTIVNEASFNEPAGH